MDLVKRHSSQYGFSPEGLDRWIEGQNQEDYAVLFDVTPKDQSFKFAETKVKKQIKDWTKHLSMLAEDIAKLGKSRPDPSKKC